MLEPDVQDFIIIKRRANTEMEMPKGGVWKIAFADFMTAMMCFFLVMWLINAANEDTRQAVASYFNPMKLSHLNPKGLQDAKVVPEGGPEAAEGHKANQTPVEGKDGERDTQRISREAIFADPYGVLAEIAGPATAARAEAAKATAMLGGEGPSGGEAFHDPFDPDFRDLARSPPPAAAELAAEPEPAEASIAVAATPVQPDAGKPAPQIEPTGDLPVERAETAVAPDSASAPDADEAEPAQDETVEAQLEDALSQAVRAGSAEASPEVAVQKTGEGLLISLTDNTDFGMFAVGSAEPRPDMVRIMERVAAILKDRPGSIIIRGHTDARPFRTQSYDNWRLSTDRAQMAYYMLVRGGLDELRVESIEGYAARRLKQPADPEGAQNRRIEILLHKDPS